MSHLVFESLDSDAYSRTYSPVALYEMTTPSIQNIGNSFSQKSPNILSGIMRRSLFALTFETDPNVNVLKYYNLTYTSTEPQAQRFKISSSATTTARMVVAIRYKEQNSYAVRNLDTNSIIEYNEWDDTVHA